MKIELLGHTSEAGVGSYAYRVVHSKSVDLKVLWEFSNELLKKTAAKVGTEGCYETAQVDVWPETLASSIVILCIALTEEGVATLEDEDVGEELEEGEG